MTRVLHVEDDDVDAEWVRRALASYQEPMELSRAVSVAEGCERLNEASYDVVVVDLTLPDADPSETLLQLLADHRELPVVVLTGCLDDEFASAAVATGVQDYLIKGEAAPGALRRALSFAMTRSERHAQITAMAMHDALTGVPNRMSFEHRLDALLEERSASDRSLVGVALIDVDDFKPMNDSRGHAFGDSVLQAVAEHLMRNVRRTDTVARLGGDEFVVILRELVDIDHAHQWMDRFYDSLRGGLIVDGEAVSVALSTGLALAPLHGEERGELVDAADKAMYAAKRAGRGCWVLSDAVSVQASPLGSAH
ncbi:MAG: GGDEF domain-containing response regulator [Pseudomonadota bacterium]